MEEQLISFETAKLAKQKGFDEPTKFLYSQWSKLMPEQANASRNSSPSIGDIYYHACTQSLLQKWLREKHNIFVSVTSYDLNFIKSFNYKFQHHVMVIDSNKDGEASIQIKVIDYETYEEALETGLQESLKLL